MKSNKKQTQKNISNISNMSNMSNMSNDETLKYILDEAENITLDDLDFDNLIKDQKHMLCDIRNILNMNKKDGEQNNTKCSAENLKTDDKLSKMIDIYKKKNILSNKPTLSHNKVKSTKTRKPSVKRVPRKSPKAKSPKAQSPKKQSPKSKSQYKKISFKKTNMFIKDPHIKNMFIIKGGKKM